MVSMQIQALAFLLLELAMSNHHTTVPPTLPLHTDTMPTVNINYRLPSFIPEQKWYGEASIKNCQMCNLALGLDIYLKSYHIKSIAIIHWRSITRHFWISTGSC